MVPGSNHTDMFRHALEPNLITKFPVTFWQKLVDKAQWLGEAASLSVAHMWPGAAK